MRLNNRNIRTLTIRQKHKLRKRVERILSEELGSGRANIMFSEHDLRRLHRALAL